MSEESRITHDCKAYEALCRNGEKMTKRCTLCRFDGSGSGFYCPRCDTETPSEDAPPLPSKIKLVSRSGRFVMQDEGGYTFVVNTEHDDDQGWSAKVEMITRRMVDEKSAVDHLKHSARAFLAMLEEE